MLMVVKTGMLSLKSSYTVPIDVLLMVCEMSDLVICSPHDQVWALFSGQIC